MVPRSRVRQTAGFASGTNRPWSAPLSGIVQTVSGSRGWLTIGKPNSDGRPLSVSSIQVAPPSSERYTPQWFCWYSVSVWPPPAMTSLWTHCPVSGNGSGLKPARTPTLRGVQVAPPSVVSNVPTEEMPTQIRCGSLGWGTIEWRIRPPAPGLP